MELYQDLKAFLKEMVDAQASDIFVVAGRPVTYSARGALKNAGDEALMPADTRAVIEDIYALADRDFALLRDNVNHDEDFSFAIGGVGRFRANVFRQRGSYSAVIRVIAFGLQRHAYADPVGVRQLGAVNPVEG